MLKMIVLRGLPASGKSTYAQRIVEGSSGIFVKVSRDDIRKSLYGVWHSDVIDEDLVTKFQEDMIRRAFKSGKSVVIDNTNIRNSYIRAFEYICAEFDAIMTVMHIDVPVDVCIERDKGRDKEVGEAVICSMDKRFQNWGKEGQLSYRTYEPNTELPSAIIVDIDGTLAIRGERGAFDWGRVGEDTLCKNVASVVRTVAQIVDIIIVSGREDVCKEETEKWLKDNKIPYDQLYMRKAGDHRRDSIVKEEIFFEHIAPSFYVRFCLDDRQQVVNMWRKIGVQCFQVDEGDF